MTNHRSLANSRIGSIVFFLLVLAVGVPAVSQTTAKIARRLDSPEDMQKLLAETAARYRDAKSLRVERKVVIVGRGDLGMSSELTWDKVAFSPGGRYRVEFLNNWNWSIVQSDGTTEWSWYPWRRQYAERPVERSPDPEASNLGGFVELLLKKIDTKLASGRVQMPQTIVIGGRRADCMVILGPTSSSQQPDPSMKQETTYWIDRKRKELVREQLVSRSMVPEHKYTVTRTYTLTELNSPMPDSLFKFTAKAGVERVERFEFEPIVLVGKVAPPLKLKTLDGKDFDLASLRGKPVLIDFWATWCVPCRESMPHLAKIYNDYKEKLALVSISEDEDPNDAARFVAKQKYSWVHLADPHGELKKNWGPSAIPRLLLVDKDGKVRFETIDVEEMKIRTELHEVDANFPPPGNKE